MSSKISIHVGLAMLSTASLALSQEASSPAPAPTPPPTATEPEANQELLIQRDQEEIKKLLEAAGIDMSQIGESRESMEPFYIFLQSLMNRKDFQLETMNEIVETYIMCICLLAESAEDLKPLPVALAPVMENYPEMGGDKRELAGGSESLLAELFASTQGMRDDFFEKNSIDAPAEDEDLTQFHKEMAMFAAELDAAGLAGDATSFEMVRQHADFVNNFLQRKDLAEHTVAELVYIQMWNIAVLAEKPEDLRELLELMSQLAKKYPNMSDALMEFVNARDPKDLSEMFEESQTSRLEFIEELKAQEKAKKAE